MACAGPLAVGLLHTATGSWNIPMTMLLILSVAQLVFGVLAGRPLVLPAAADRAAPAEARSPTRVSVTGRSR